MHGSVRIRIKSPNLNLTLPFQEQKSAPKIESSSGVWMTAGKEKIYLGETSLVLSITILVYIFLQTYRNSTKLTDWQNAHKKKVLKRAQVLIL